MILHGQGTKPSYNTLIEPVTETWADHQERFNDTGDKVKVEHECWGGWSDGDGAGCKQDKPQRTWSRRAVTTDPDAFVK